jgi:hypothetical protein
MAPARAPHKGEIQIPTNHITWQLSSNGLEATRDFVYRAVITRNTKRDPGYQFKTYPEGNVLAHLKANRALYQGAVFSILSEWDRRGRPKTDENRHDFTEWTQSLDWIVQKLFHLPPLMDGHVEEILRISDRALSWLRAVAIAAEKKSRLDEGLTTTEIVDLCLSLGIELPGVRPYADSDQIAMAAGRLLSRLFQNPEIVRIDRFQVHRETREEYDQNNDKKFPKHYYFFEKRSDH